MAKTANEQLRDALVRHQVLLAPYTSGLQRIVTKLLDATEADLRSLIERRLRAAAERGGMDFGPQVTARLKVLQKAIAELRKQPFDAALLKLSQELRDLIAQERAFVATSLQTVAPVRLDLVLPPVAQLGALVTTEPLQGRILKQWFGDLRAADTRRIMDQLRVGLAQGESIDQITRRVVGSVRLRGTDGVTELTRQQVRSVTRTAVQTMSAAARQITYEANSDLFSEELYVATLDSRTTFICASLDGKFFPLGEGPHPPLHFNCRSMRVPALDREGLSSRPFKTVTNQQLVREFGQQNGLGDLSRRSQLPFGMKGKFDAFARTRIRELTGTVPEGVTYGTWLRSQSATFQDEVLGRTKGALFRRGGLEMDKFVTRAGHEYSLAELATREASAFRAAGLDPEDFL